jgi:type II secretory pathway component PulF
MPGVRPVAADALAGAARQLGYALEQTASIDEAFRRLRAACDPRQQTVVQQLENLLRSPESGSDASQAPPRSIYSTLAWLLRRLPEPERSAAAFFDEFRRSQLITMSAMAAVKGEFVALLSYLGAVLAVLFVVVGVYGLFVLPQFKGFYGGFGRQLPALTVFVFGRGAPLYALALLLASGLLAFLGSFVYHLRRQIRRYEPMPASYRSVPLVGRVARTYNRFLWLSYAALLRAGNLSPDQSLRLAGTRLPMVATDAWAGPLPDTEPHLGSGSSELLCDLATAARLGKLEQEMQFQQQATVDEFLAALSRCRRQTQIALTILIYYLVAMFVSAMYLPIFSLGSGI